LSIFVSKNKVVDELTTAINRFDPGPVLIHTDLLKVGIIDKMKKRDEICHDYEQMIVDIFSKCEFLIPTFNYDFCRDGIYDINNSTGQVGAFSAYIANRYPPQRTRTPIFNFCLFNNHSFGQKEVKNPFDSDSAFGTLHSLGGTVAFLGAGFESNTFLHYVEESLKIGYRYIKPFDGKIIYDNKVIPWKIDYRVRPLVENAVEYDWIRIQSDLVETGILKESPLGNSFILWYNTTKLYDFFTSKIKTDPFYLLTKRSRQITTKLYEQFGNPLTYDRVEKIKINQ